MQTHFCAAMAVLATLTLATTPAGAVQAEGANWPGPGPGARNPLIDKVMKADARFRDVAEAVSEGYAPIPCTSGGGGGAMGIHCVNADLLGDDKLDLAHPEAVMYEPEPDGSLRLVGVEYITFKGPASLDGQLFSYSGAPNRYGLPAFYALHVWAWRANPTGPFADMNPRVSCAAARPG